MYVYIFSRIKKKDFQMKKLYIFKFTFVYNTLILVCIHTKLTIMAK
jgi:hypothetical protein